MITEKEIRDILNKIIPELKKVDNLERQNKKGSPIFYPSYPVITDYAERIAIHAEVGKFPDRLFLERSPNQEEKEFQYVKKNYKQVTLPVFVDYISTITRPFHDANWNIDYVEDVDKFKEFPFQEYVDKQIKNYGYWLWPKRPFYFWVFACFFPLAFISGAGRAWPGRGYGNAHLGRALRQVWR